MRPHPPPTTTTTAAPALEAGRPSHPPRRGGPRGDRTPPPAPEPPRRPRDTRRGPEILDKERTMKVFCDWYGGPNYAPPEPLDREAYHSIHDAEAELWRRADDNPYYPCVKDSEMLVYGALDAEYPIMRLYFGPRGGIRREPC